MGPVTGSTAARIAPATLGQISVETQDTSLMQAENEHSEPVDADVRRPTPFAPATTSMSLSVGHGAPRVEPVSRTTDFSGDTSTQQFPTDLDEPGTSAPATLSQVASVCHEASPARILPLAVSSAPRHAQPISSIAAPAPHLAVSETSSPGQSSIAQMNVEAPVDKIRLKIKVKPMTTGNKRGTKLRPGTSLTAR